MRINPKKETPRGTLHNPRSNQRQKFLADYYKNKDTPINNSQAPIVNVNKVKNTLTFSSTENTTEENYASDYRSEDTTRSKLVKIDGDCLAIIRMCTEKLQSNPLNEKALSLRANAFLRKRDFDSVFLIFNNEKGNERRY